MKRKYAGSVCMYTRKKRKYFRARVQCKGELHLKDFRFAEENSEDIKKKAEQWRTQKSDELGLTQEITSHVGNGIEIPKNIKEYVAGFFDGDGCIDVRMGRKRGGGLRIIFSQSKNETIPEVLTFIQKYYGGKITSRDRSSQKGRENDRKEYNLCITAWESKPLLLDLAKYTILKQPQCEKAILFLETSEKMRILWDHPIRIDVATSLKQMKKEYNKAIIDKEKLTNPYLAGMFDADGSVYFMHKTSVRSSIAQASSLPFLKSLCEIIPKCRLDTNKKQVIIPPKSSFLNDIYIFVVNKKKQVNLALEAMGLIAKPKRERDNERLQYINERVSFLNKHS